MDVLRSFLLLFERSQTERKLRVCVASGCLFRSTGKEHAVVTRQKEKNFAASFFFFSSPSSSSTLSFLFRFLASKQDGFYFFFFFSPVDVSVNVGWLLEQRQAGFVPEMRRKKKINTSLLVWVRLAYRTVFSSSRT